MHILLASNHPPLRTNFHTCIDKFYELLSSTDSLKIGVGFVSQESLMELKRIIELNGKPRLQLVIGMHYRHGFEAKQLQAARSLHTYLQENNMGSVYITVSFEYHGKVYSFSNHNGTFAGIVGSNNLHSIVPSTNRMYESAICTDDHTVTAQIDGFIDDLISNASKPMHDIRDEDIRIIQSTLLENTPHVCKTNSVEKATEISFKIPLKASERQSKSNLNVYFGKGRKDKRGMIRPRSWYEVEIIVPQNITSQQNYPASHIDGGNFTVVTDDGWRFKCKVSGDYNKNFRSEGDLTILGKWIKGRLENEGVLSPGQLVTDKVLLEYGREDLDFIKTSEPNVWLLRFERPRAS